MEYEPTIGLVPIFFTAHSGIRKSRILDLLPIDKVDGQIGKIHVEL